MNERDKAAVPGADFAVGRNVRADHATSGKHCFSNGQPETFGNRRGEKQLAISIAPPELGVRDTVSECDAMREFWLFDQPVNARRLRAGHSNNQKLRVDCNRSEGMESPEDFDCEWDVFIAAMLGDAEKERGAIPRLDQSGPGYAEIDFDAVMDRDCLLQVLRIPDAEAKLRAVRDAGDGVNSS
jgi:hypothetical protein